MLYDLAYCFYSNLMVYYRPTSLIGDFFMKKWKQTLIVTSSVLLLTIAHFSAASLKATDNFAVNGKVSICHATASSTNPYVQEDPNISNNGDLDGGHLNHTGPVYPASNWGDIIPPYTFTYCADGGYTLIGSICEKNSKPDEAPMIFLYNGLNWTTAGQAIYNNQCVYNTTTPTPSVTPTVTPSVTPSVTPTITPSITPTVTPTVTPIVTVTPTITPTPTTDPCANNACVTPTPTPTSSGCTSNCGSSNNNSSSGGSSSSQPIQAVLGTSTMADTGTFTQNMMTLLFTLGMMILALGAKSYAKEKKN